MSVLENGIMREMHKVMAQGNSLIAQFYEERDKVEAMDLFSLYELYSRMICQCDEIIDNFNDVMKAYNLTNIYNNRKGINQVNDYVTNMIETEFYQARNKVISLLQYLERHQFYIDKVLDEYPTLQ